MRFDQVAPSSFPPAPAAGEVVVWRVDLDAAAGSDPAASDRGLSGAERARARAFQNPAAARTFVAGRRALRALLGRDLRLPPGRVDLVLGARGKPALAAGTPGLSFNVSHAGGILLVALGRNGDLGVDVEPAPAPDGFRDVARSYFATAELRLLDSLPPDRAGDAFLRLWTRKEAVVKASGLGMSLPPDRVRVSAEPDAARIIDLPPDQGDPSRWSLHDLSPGPDLVAALAVRGGPEGRPVGYACSLDDLL